MFWILIIPSLALSVYMVVSLMSMRKHDKVLYDFCQIRRDAISVIDRRGMDFDRVAYHSLRHVIEGLNVVIHEYEGCKVHIFNIRRLVALLKNYKHVAHQVGKVLPHNDDEILQIHRRFNYAMVRAFLAYTPLIRSEIAALVLFKLLTFLGNTGIGSLKGAAAHLGWILEEMKRHNTPVTH